MRSLSVNFRFLNLVLMIGLIFGCGRDAHESQLSVDYKDHLIAYQPPPDGFDLSQLIDSNHEHIITIDEVPSELQSPLRRITANLREHGVTSLFSKMKDQLAKKQFTVSIFSGPANLFYEHSKETGEKKLMSRFELLPGSGVSFALTSKPVEHSKCIDLHCFATKKIGEYVSMSLEVGGKAEIIEGEPKKFTGEVVGSIKAGGFATRITFTRKPDGTYKASMPYGLFMGNDMVRSIRNYFGVDQFAIVGPVNLGRWIFGYNKEKQFGFHPVKDHLDIDLGEAMSCQKSRTPS